MRGIDDQIKNLEAQQGDRDRDTALVQTLQEIRREIADLRQRVDALEKRR